MFRDQRNYSPIYLGLCVFSTATMSIISSILCFRISTLSDTLNSFILNLNSSISQLNVTENQEDFDIIAHQIQNITILLNEIVHKFI